jgi:hypothetical protein
MSLTLFIPTMTVLLYFAAGFLREVLCVLYYRAVSTKHPLKASGLAGGLELYDLLVLASIIQSGWNPVLLMGYVGGVFWGTFVATKMSK